MKFRFERNIFLSWDRNIFCFEISTVLLSLTIFNAKCLINDFYISRTTASEPDNKQ